MVYSFDGLHIVSGFFDGTILVWDAESGEIAGEPITGHGDCVKSVCISPCGKRVVSGSQGGTARVWESPVETICIFLSIVILGWGKARLLVDT